MDIIEFQLISQMKDNVWKKIMTGVVQDWTIKNCETIAHNVNSVTDLTIDAKTIQRFSQLNIKDEIEQKNSKDILAMFLNGVRAIDRQIDKSIFVNMLKKLSEEDSPISIFVGDYRLYYKSRTLERLSSDVFITIYKDGSSTFRTDLGEIFNGHVVYKNTSLFFEFNNSFENLFLIANVGITKNENFLKYLPSIICAVGGKITLPYSSAVLLVKENKQIFEIERVHAYFNYFNKHTKISIDENLIHILDIEIPIEEAINIAKSKEYIESIVGNWIAYSLSGSREEKGVYQSKMRIENSNTVIYNGNLVSYPQGEVKIVGEDVYIYFYGRKNALLTANLQYRDIDKIDEILAGYTTISTRSHSPVLGMVLLVRDKSTSFNEIEVKYIVEQSPEYELLLKQGVIAKLNHKPVELH